MGTTLAFPPKWPLKMGTGLAASAAHPRPNNIWVPPPPPRASDIKHKTWFESTSHRYTHIPLYTNLAFTDCVGASLKIALNISMCLKIDKTLIGMGFTTGDVPTARVSALMQLKTQNCPQMSVRTSPLPPTHTSLRKILLVQEFFVSLW